MRFLASYLPCKRAGVTQPPYYLTIHADTLNNAIKQAERYTRKAFVCAGVTIKE